MSKWTDEQQNAIDSRGGTVLVSAAAGSGKTAVLVERVIKRITDENNPCDADRILVVTFTKAAAAEMKERISARLTELIRCNPDNVRLKRQKLLLERAHISTIHSFCSSVIKEYFQNLDIPADFRIAEGAELQVLRNEAVEEILDEMYENDDREQFIELVEQVSSEKNDRELSSTILNLSDYISSHPFPEQWLESRLEMFSDIGEDGGIWLKIIKDYVKSAVKCCLDMNHSMQTAFSSSPEAVNAYSHAFFEDESQYIKILETDDWDRLFRLISDFQWARLSPLKGDTFNFVKENRNEQKEIIKKLKTYLCADMKMHREDVARLAPIVGALFELVSRFRTRFDDKKRELGCVDFSDLEHMTIELLTEHSDNEILQTPIASEISKEFEEILIDEYQDTNEAQDMIFRAVSRNGENLFMVGDVKQSIYGFRQAMPKLFLDKYKQFSEYLNGYPAKITLSKNFRSRGEVTDIVNFFFSQIMSEAVGDIKYDEHHMLNKGREFPPAPDNQCELLLCDPKIKSADSDEAEAAMIAQKINEMISQGYKVTDKNGSFRNAKFSDFCILLRSTKGHADTFAQTLEICGVPAYTPDSSGFFAAREVSLALSILGIISNPLDDISLTAVLLSPVFSFSPDEITKIRLVNRNVPLYSVLTEAAENGDKKCGDFIEFIASMRKLAVSVPCDRLIMKIYESTGLTDIVGAMKNGGGRIANLRMLIEYARSYEKTGIGGVSGFLRFMDRIRDTRGDLQSASAVSSNADVVKIISVHASKGLEFPVCIVAGLGTKFNKRSLYDNLLIHPQLGVGMRILGSERLNRYNTIPRAALNLSLEHEAISEEMRILYVAMTRAKEKLILSAAVSSLENKIVKLASSLDGVSVIPDFKIRNCGSFADWVILCALRHPDTDFLRRISDAGNIRLTECSVPLSVTIDFSDEQQIAQKTEQETATPDSDVLSVLSERAKFIYPYTELEGIPSKVTASGLSHSTNKTSFIKRPRFLTDEALTPTERGTALHKFMQFADFEAAKANLTAEITRMTELGYLTDKEAETVDEKKLRVFFDSELMQEIESADEATREMRFAYELPIQLIAPDIKSDETVFLQGVADCVYRKNGKIYIIDYKTDRIYDENRLREMYAPQLELYAKAFEKILNSQVGGKYIYSFTINKKIEL